MTGQGIDQVVFRPGQLSYSYKVQFSFRSLSSSENSVGQNDINIMTWNDLMSLSLQCKNPDIMTGNPKPGNR